MGKALRPGHLENGVLVGEEGMLFLAGGAHSVMEYVTGVRRLSKESVAAFHANHEERRSWSERSNIRFVHLITPDKQSIFPELWPGKAAVLRLGDELISALKASDEVLYPLSLLRAGGLKSVSRVDTHYSDFGSLIVAASVVEYFTGETQEEMLSLVAAGTWTASKTFGDLGSKLTPPQEATDWVHDVKTLGRQLSNNVVGGNDGIMDIYLNGRAPIKKRLALIGDSFGRTMCKFLHLWFREVVFLRSRFFHQEFLQLFRPHYIVSQNAERYLSSVALDRERTHFLLMPYHRAERYDPPKEFTAALAELLAVGQPRYVAFLHKEFDGAESAPATR